MRSFSFPKYQHSAVRELGQRYGYPRCCIRAFLNNKTRTPAQNDSKVHKHYGFIPCPKHAKEIQDGKITLESLIHNRTSTFPFPNGD